LRNSEIRGGREVRAVEKRAVEERGGRALSGSLWVSGPVTVSVRSRAAIASPCAAGEVLTAASYCVVLLMLLCRVSW
jgi:hypothetical protein